MPAGDLFQLVLFQGLHHFFDFHNHYILSSIGECTQPYFGWGSCGVFCSSKNGDNIVRPFTQCAAAVGAIPTEPKTMSTAAAFKYGTC